MMSGVRHGETDSFAGLCEYVVQGAFSPWPFPYWPRPPLPWTMSPLPWMGHPPWHPYWPRPPWQRVAALPSSTFGLSAKVQDPSFVVFSLLPWPVPATASETLFLSLLLALSCTWFCRLLLPLLLAFRHSFV